MNILKQIQKNKKITLIFIFFISISLTVLLMPQFAHAGPLAWITDPLGSIKAAFCSILDGMSEMMLRVGLAILALSLTVTETLIKSGTESPTFQANITSLRNFAFGMMAIVLVVISFSQVLNMGKDKFGAKALLPKMFIASILMLFSTLICYVVYDLGSIMATSLVGDDISAVVYQGAAGKDRAEDVMGPWDGILGDDSSGIRNEQDGSNENIMIHFAFMFVAFIGAIAYIILGIIMIFRSWAVMLFIVLAPLAFASLVLPWTASWHKKWWSEYAKWVFFLPVSLLILKVGGSIIATYNSSITGLSGTIGDIVGITVAPLIEALFMVIGSIITVVAAIFLPLKMLGKLGSEIQRISKGYAGRKTGVTPYLQARTTEQKRAAGEKAQKNISKVSRMMGDGAVGGFFGRALTGMSKETTLDRLHDRHKKLDLLNLSGSERIALSEGGLTGFEKHIQTRAKSGDADPTEIQRLRRKQQALKGITNNDGEMQQLAFTHMMEDSKAADSQGIGPAAYFKVKYGGEADTNVHAARALVGHVQSRKRSADALTSYSKKDVLMYQSAVQLLNTHPEGGLLDENGRRKPGQVEFMTTEMASKLTDPANKSKLGNAETEWRDLALKSQKNLPPGYIPNQPGPAAGGPAAGGPAAGGPAAGGPAAGDGAASPRTTGTRGNRNP